jgi:hypothetical protein
MENRIPLLKYYKLVRITSVIEQDCRMLEHSPPDIHKADEMVIVGLVDPTHAAFIVGIVT